LWLAWLTALDAWPQEAALWRVSISTSGTASASVTWKGSAVPPDIPGAAVAAGQLGLVLTDVFVRSAVEPAVGGQREEGSDEDEDNYLPRFVLKLNYSAKRME